VLLEVLLHVEVLHASEGVQVAAAPAVQRPEPLQASLTVQPSLSLLQDVPAVALVVPHAELYPFPPSTHAERRHGGLFAAEQSRLLPTPHTAPMTGSFPEQVSSVQPLLSASHMPAAGAGDLGTGEQL
jgi:hypothetical protein